MNPIKILIPSRTGREARLKEAINSLEKNANYPHEIIVYTGEEGGASKAWRKMIEESADEDRIFIFADDNIMRKDCLKLLAEEFDKKFPDGWGVADGTMERYPGEARRDLTMIPLSTGKFLKKYWYSGYLSYFIDDELYAVSSPMKKYALVPDATAEHNHATTKPELMDETYRRATPNMEIDRKLYLSRKLRSMNFTHPEKIEWDR